MRRNSYKDNKPLPSGAFTPEEAKNSAAPRKITPMMLVNDVARLWHKRVDVAAPSEFRQKSNREVLRELAIKEGVSQLDIAKKTHLKPPTISVTLGKLEETGVIMRTVDPMDLRASKVYLTDKGRGINATLREAFKNADETALKGFTDEECEALLSMLKRMVDNLNEASAE